MAAKDASKGKDGKAVVRVLMRRHGQSYAEQAGVRLTGNTPSPLFELLNLSLLLSARIAADKAVEAARALVQAKLTTPKKMAAASWQDRVDVITWHGYKRYDESASRMLGDTANKVLDAYGGDLRRLRDEAGRDVQQEHRLLQQFKGIGSVGADIFLREVQAVWPEVYPYADQKVLEAAGRLGLPRNARGLASLVPKRQFPRLCAALIRTHLSRDYEDIKAAARS
jgi:endonuclease III